MRPFQPEPDLSERVHDALVEAICSGDLKPGARITQEELAAKFGVSRQPVLQAMMLLRREGFLIEAGRKGVCVAPLEPQKVRDLYGVRAALDAAAARLAARRFTPQLAKRGRELIEAGKRAVARGHLPAAIEADIAFHLFIYEASGNGMLADTAQPHWQHLRRTMAAVLGEHDLRANIWREHEAILAALEGGDAARAEALIRDHAELNGDILADRLDKTTTAGAAAVAAA
jgi:DNA-binding GntR family transcriptional regulator